MMKNFKKLLLSIQDASMNEHNLRNHHGSMSVGLLRRKGDSEQVDDILMIRF